MAPSGLVRMREKPQPPLRGDEDGQIGCDEFGTYTISHSGFVDMGDWRCGHVYNDYPDSDSYHYLNKQGWYYSQNPDGSAEKMHLKTREAKYRSPGSSWDDWRDDSEDVDWESLAEKPDPCIAACPSLDENFWKSVEMRGEVYKKQHQWKIEKIRKRKAAKETSDRQVSNLHAAASVSSNPIRKEHQRDQGTQEAFSYPEKELKQGTRKRPRSEETSEDANEPSNKATKNESRKSITESDPN